MRYRSLDRILKQRSRLSMQGTAATVHMAEVLRLRGSTRYDVRTGGGRVVRKVGGQPSLAIGNVVSIVSHPGSMKKVSIVSKENIRAAGLITVNV